MFSKKLQTQLIYRLRQTKEELLYSKTSRETERYVLTQRNSPILGVAHCDYVEHAWSLPSYFDERSSIRAGQVDDRVGVWILLDVLPELMPDIPIDVLLTTDEEKGRSSASEVKEDLDYNWTFQFDRRGTDFVTYDLASDKFVTAFKKLTSIPIGIGSFSDICAIPDTCGSRINIGTAYYDEHTPDAYVDLYECYNQVIRFTKFARKYYNKSFPFSRPKPKYKRPRFDRDEFWHGSYKDSSQSTFTSSSGKTYIDEVDEEFEALYGRSYSEEYTPPTKPIKPLPPVVKPPIDNTPLLGSELIMRDYVSALHAHLIEDAYNRFGLSLVGVAKVFAENGITFPKNYNTSTDAVTMSIERDINALWNIKRAALKAIADAAALEADNNRKDSK